MGVTGSKRCSRVKQSLFVEHTALYAMRLDQLTGHYLQLYHKRLSASYPLPWRVGLVAKRKREIHQLIYREQSDSYSQRPPVGHSDVDAAA